MGSWSTYAWGSQHCDKSTVRAIVFHFLNEKISCRCPYDKADSVSFLAKELLRTPNKNIWDSLKSDSKLFLLLLEGGIYWGFNPGAVYH